MEKLKSKDKLLKSIILCKPTEGLFLVVQQLGGNCWEMASLQKETTQTNLGPAKVKKKIKMREIVTLIISLIMSFAAMAQTNSAQIYHDKAIHHIENEEYDKAIEILTVGIRILPDSVSLYDSRGSLLNAFGLFKEAINDYSTAIDKTQDTWMKSHLLANRGGTKYRIRDFQGAYEDLIDAIQLDSTNIDALNNLAAVCDEVNKPEDTAKYLEQIIRIDSTYAPAYVNLGFMYQGKEQHEKAIAIFDKAVELAPDEALGYSNRSFSKLKIKNLKSAMEDINKSIHMMPSNSYAYKIRALIEIEKGNVENACKDLELATEHGYTQQYGEEVNELKTKYCQ